MRRLTVRRGLDANIDLGMHANRIRDLGYQWVGRFFKHSPNRLTLGEAIALSREGLSIVSIVEDGFPISPNYFTAQRGVQDGQFALQMAGRVGQPEGSAIYFAVDFDATAANMPDIARYFRAVHSAFPADIGYSIGVYGSGAVCAHLLRHTPVSFAWLAAPTEWRGSRTFRGWNLKQTAVNHPLDDLQVDLDESRGHGGGWRR